MSVCFFGIDLAWRTDGNHTGVAVLQGDRSGVALAQVSEGLVSRAQVVEFVTKHATTDSVAAIDASLVVTNTKGQRACETAVSSAFARYWAPCHSTRIGKPNWDAGTKIVEALQSIGFAHDFDMVRARAQQGRWLFEVYPHPAMVRLFDLEKRLKYKKGSPAEKRDGLSALRTYIAGLSGLMPSEEWLRLSNVELSTLRGEGLKRYEDSLDAVFCGYLAWYCWRWGAERNEIFGTLREGYIVVPKAINAIGSSE